MLKHRIYLTPNSPDEFDDDLEQSKPERIRGITWQAVQLDVVQPSRWAIVNWEFGFVAVVFRVEGSILDAVRDTPIDVVMNLAPRKGIGACFSPYPEDVEFRMTREVSEHVQARIDRVKSLASENKNSFTLMKAVQRMNKTEPITINGVEIIPEENLVGYLKDLIDKFDDFINNSNPVSLAWSVIAKKRPWLDPDYKMRVK